jgi:hypothetical protein
MPVAQEARDERARKSRLQGRLNTTTGARQRKKMIMCNGRGQPSGGLRGENVSREFERRKRGKEAYLGKGKKTNTWENGRRRSLVFFEFERRRHRRRCAERHVSGFEMTRRS